MGNEPLEVNPRVQGAIWIGLVAVWADFSVVACGRVLSASGLFALDDAQELNRSRGEKRHGQRHVRASGRHDTQCRVADVAEQDRQQGQAKGLTHCFLGLNSLQHIVVKRR